MPAPISHGLFVLALWLGLGWATGAHAQAAPAALPTWTITVRDGVFEPKRLEVTAGQRIKFILKNEGPGPLEFENADLHIEKILAANAESFVVVKLPPGEHLFVDEFNIATGELLVIAK
ncbi:MAG: cupredoxin domain-containing protein [Sulfuritalea sp.]|nr:cupredoxin domain-containing protein [Sulfuritalea sp.]